MTTISTELSICLSAIFTALYVGSLYLSRAGRLAFRAPPVNVPNGQERVRVANERWRNDPKVIRARLIAVILSTIGSCLLVDAVIAISNGTTRFKDLPSVVEEATTLLGLDFTLPRIRSILPHLLAPLLFVGPLYVEHLDSRLPLQHRWSYNEDFFMKFTSLQGLRNYVVAPITEEVVFRSCIVGMMKLSGASVTKMVFAGPLWFGLAHGHHAWELFNIYGRTKDALVRALVTSLVQLSYTTVFGWFTTFLFLRTGSIYPAITSHIFCNIMGLPSPGWATRAHPSKKLLIWASHLIGVIGFAVALSPWTAS